MTDWTLTTTEAEGHPCRICDEPIAPGQSALLIHRRSDGTDTVHAACVRSTTIDWAAHLATLTDIGVDAELVMVRAALPNWRVWRWRRDRDPTTITRGGRWRLAVDFATTSSLIAEYGPELQTYPDEYGPIVISAGTVGLDDFVAACRDNEPTPDDPRYAILNGNEPAVARRWPEPGWKSAFADTPLQEPCC